MFILTVFVLTRFYCINSTFLSEVEISLRSSSECASLSVEGYIVYSACTTDVDRGMHVVVLNLGTGRVMATRRFDTYYPGADVELLAFLGALSVARVVCVMVMDEASFNLGEKARNKLKLMGSDHIESLGKSCRIILIRNCY